MFYDDGYLKIPVKRVRSPLTGWWNQANKPQKAQPVLQVEVRALGGFGTQWINIPAHWLVTDAAKVAKFDDFRERNKLYNF